MPSDSWLQLLVYRKDLFAKAGLPAPDTYAKLVKSAKTLKKTGLQEGASVATDPADVFTQQSFESIALANNCQLVNSSAKVTLDSPACQDAFSLYDTLGRTYGVTGTQTVDSTRSTYFAGQSAMVVWSTFLLDELAGLRNDALPSCPAVRPRQEVPLRQQRCGHRALRPGQQDAGPVRRGRVLDGHQDRQHHRCEEVASST